LLAASADLVGDAWRDENAHPRRQLDLLPVGNDRSFASENIDDLLFMRMGLSWGQRAFRELDQPKGEIASLAIEWTEEVKPIPTREMVDRARIDMSNFQFSHSVLTLQSG
jgi:hypothetical protein